MARATRRALWEKWRRFDVDERRTLRLAVLMIPTMHVVVRLMGFNRLQQRVARTRAVTGLPYVPTADAVRTCVVNINRAKRYSPLPGNCLSQSLALTWMLRRRGIDPALRLGVRLTGPAFDAHAWVEYDGRVLNDTQDVHTRFTPLTAPVQRERTR